MNDSPLDAPFTPTPGTGEPAQETPPLREALCALLNRYCEENNSNTPDYILADTLLGVLELLNDAIIKRDTWYHGRVVSIENIGSINREPG